MPWRRWTAASQPATMAGDRASEHRSGSPGGHKRSARQCGSSRSRNTSPHRIWSPASMPRWSAARGYHPRRDRTGRDQPDGACRRDRRAAPAVDGRGRHHRAGALQQRPRPRSRCRARTAWRMAARDERLPGRGHRPPSRPLRRLCRAADAEPRRLRRRAGTRGEGARLRGRAHQRHDRGPLSRSSEL